MIRLPSLLSVLAIFAALVMLADQVDARPGGGGGFGSRGSRTFSAPPTTQTAPKAAAPLQRTQAQPARPNATNPAATAPGGLFNRPGLMGGMLAGFLGAGLFGMLFGNGLLGGLGGLSSLFGLLLQIGLVVIVARLGWSWWQRRQGLATAGGPSFRDMNQYGQGGSAAAAPAAAGAASTGAFGAGPVTLEKADFDTFERLLTDVTQAYAAAELGRLRTLATPEMVGYFEEDIARQKSRGLKNEVGNIHLLQGDLAEAWRESDSEYATVAMRYSLVDVWVDAAGAIVDGTREPQEVVEHWTFLRERGGPWEVSAIQES